MASYKVSVPHSLGQSSARARVETFLEAVQRDYADQVQDVSGEWQENSLHFRFATYGMKISGAMNVGENQVDVSGPLPLLAAMFRGKIEQQIKDELGKLLT